MSGKGTVIRDKHTLNMDVAISVLSNWASHLIYQILIFLIFKLEFLPMNGDEI